MKWVRDASGRLPERPYYEPAELDQECEALVSTFLRRRYGAVRYPLSTDDLTVLVEEHVADLDLYADLFGEGAGVEGVTEFAREGKPRVRISAALSDSASRASRLRTTLAHELGHVRLHAFLWSRAGMAGGGIAGGKGAGPRAPAPVRPELVEGPTSSHPGAFGNIRCLRDSIARPQRADWLEWQAGYACGAFLMPASALWATVQAALGARRPPLFFRTAAAASLARRVQAAFGVSQQAAQVRLLQAGVLTREVPSALRHSVALKRTRPVGYTR